jgi:hypothetical protein
MGEPRENYRPAASRWQTLLRNVVWVHLAMKGLELATFIVMCIGRCKLYHTITTRQIVEGPGGSMSWVVGLPNNSYKLNTNTAWVRAWFCRLQKGALDLQPQVIVYQLLAYGRWFSQSTPASSTTKTGRHDIAEILLKVALKHNK